MTPELSLASLSPARRRLLDLLREIRCGKVIHLQVRGGEPVFDPPPRVLRRLKFPGENGPLLPTSRFTLKKHHTDFLALLDALGDGTIESLSVQDGLPLSAEVAG